MKMSEIHSRKNFSTFFILTKLKYIIFYPNVGSDKSENTNFYIGYTYSRCKCDIFISVMRIIDAKMFFTLVIYITDVTSHAHRLKSLNLAPSQKIIHFNFTGMKNILKICKGEFQTFPYL